jgi:glycosyltransferase involved in cell wall biosynthesis
MLFFSVVIPVYNRPDEIDELLESLTKQTYSAFEIIVVEDGSQRTCRNEVNKYIENLNIQYLVKDNSGPGLSRNYGAKYAKGDYIVFFDSDCIIPEKYFEIVLNELNSEKIDAYGGPDMAHENFTPIQKAISYSMTSILTTGGIRGGKERVDKFHPRSFNMGFSKEVFRQTGGFSEMRFGEDVDMSLRIIKAGFKTKLISQAAVYHKRRTNFKQFFKQVYNSGIARINLYRRHPKSLKLVHFLPAIFFEGSIILIILSIFSLWFLSPFLVLILLFFIDASRKTKSIKISFLSVIASFIQLWAYGSGFSLAFYKRILLKKGEFKAFANSFYQ